MNDFTYAKVVQVEQALWEVEAISQAKFLGGGTNLLDLMKGEIECASHLVDVRCIPELTRIEPITDGGLRIGASVTNSEVANDPLVRTRYPLLAQAILSGANKQLRNAATVGGNLLQRTRCHYFYDTAFKECNKRCLGTGCAAINGFTRMHAILGASPECIAVNPSDMNVALAALDASVYVQGPKGERCIPFSEFHRLPGDRPDLDTTLQCGELITAVDLPPSPFSDHSFYLKVRDRTSFAFALVSVAAALSFDGSIVKDARIALGGVAHKPWRACTAEQLLVGQVITEELLQEVASTALEEAVPQRDNEFKIELARRSIVRALKQAATGSAS
jgi:xanthine dehydrogenase YagS FAD-binding subunit